MWCLCHLQTILALYEALLAISREPKCLYGLREKQGRVGEIRGMFQRQSNRTPAMPGEWQITLECDLDLSSEYVDFIF